MNRKQRRAFRAAQKKNFATKALSFCPEHGPYDKSCLCPCYDPGGSHAHQRDKYGTEEWTEQIDFQPMTNDSGDAIGFCPIHGEVVVSDIGIFQCGCYDEDGNKIVHLTDNPSESEEH